LPLTYDPPVDSVSPLEFERQADQTVRSWTGARQPIARLAPETKLALADVDEGPHISTTTLLDALAARPPWRRASEEDCFFTSATSGGRQRSQNRDNFWFRHTH
jgi:hypothetical protein